MFALAHPADAQLHWFFGETDAVTVPLSWAVVLGVEQCSDNDMNAGTQSFPAELCIVVRQSLTSLFSGFNVVADHVDNSVSRLLFV